MIDPKHAVLLGVVAASALTMVYAASASEKATAPAEARTAITTKLRLIDGAGGKGKGTVDAEAASGATPWSHAKALERKSHTRLRRAEIALMLVKERLEMILAAEKRRDAQRAEDDGRRLTKLQTLEKLAGVYVKMKVQKAGQILEALDAETASDVLALMPPKRAAKIVASMKPNKAAALLQRWTVAAEAR